MRYLPRLPRGLIGLLFILAFAGHPMRVARADIEEDVGEATEKGIEFLLKEIEAKQAETGDFNGMNMGKIALETYALIVAGVGVEHPLIQKNFNTLAKMGLDTTYCIACYLFALDAAISQLQADVAMASPSQKFRDDPSIGAQYRPRLEAGVSALVKIRQKTGGWNYTSAGPRFDNSNTQFGVLGLGVGLKRRVPIPKDVWIEVVNHFLKCQAKNGPETEIKIRYREKGDSKDDQIIIIDKSKDAEKGKKKEKDSKKGSPTVVLKAPVVEGEAIKANARGWGYEASGESWNMTCGGLSSLILAEQALRGQAAPDVQSGVNKAIRDGYAWIIRNWNVRGGGGWSYYGIYSLEKVGDLAEVKLFADHDWFNELREAVLSEQRVDGSWPGPNKEQIRWNSAFALLVLNRATALIAQGGREPRLVGTGAGGDRVKGTDDDKNWIHIKKYERDFNVPQILRQVKIRPTPGLLNILELALTSYMELKPEDAGYLVGSLARARDVAATRKLGKLKEFLEEMLLKITGVKYEQTDQYHSWCKRFVDIDKIGREMKDPGGWLVKIHPKTTKSAPLKRKLIWAIGRCRIAEAADLLIGDLSSEDTDIRAAAYSTLSLMARQISQDAIPVFDAKAAVAVRDPQIAEIKGWLARAKPAEKAAEKPAEKAAEKPAEKAAEKPAEKK